MTDIANLPTVAKCTYTGIVNSVDAQSSAKCIKTAPFVGGTLERQCQVIHSSRDMAAPFGAEIRSMRVRMGLTQKEFGAIAGLHRNTISKLERIKTAAKAKEIDDKTLKLLATAFETSPAAMMELAGRQRDDLPSINYEDSPRPPALRYESVSAGLLKVTEARRLSQTLGGNERFEVRLIGESMAPDFPDGAWVRFSRPLAAREGIVFKKDYLVWISTGESTFKQIIADPRDPEQYLVLRARNADRKRFPDQRIHRQDILYIARAVALVVETQLS